MYAKVFQQIFDSSISEDYRVRFVFEDMLKLANVDGVVDMTHEAIARRTNVPLEIVQLGITNLESPDPKSRSKDHEGRRIVRLDEHRDWGWFIVNYHYYRDLVSEEQRREKTKLRTRKWREKKAGDAPVTHGDAHVTPCDGGDAMQREMQRETPTKLPTKQKKLSKSEVSLACRLETALNSQWVNDAGKWIGRIRQHFDKSERVCAEVESAIKEDRITETPAQYAEFTWKEFK